MEQFLTFALADETYGINVLRVREVLESISYTRVPTAPPVLKGVFNLRGSVIPVYDLAVKLGLEQSGGTEMAGVVAELRLDEEELLIGLLVDRVDQVISIEPGQIQAPPKMGASGKADFVSGVVRQGESFIILIDPDRLVDERDLSGDVQEDEA